MHVSQFVRPCICPRGSLQVATSGFECRHNVDLHNKQCLEEKSDTRETLVVTVVTQR